MKLIGIMSLDADVEDVKYIFEEHDVQLFSEIRIKGHTQATIEKHGWAPATLDTPYSVMCIAIVDKLRADDIMNDITRRIETARSEHPIRAFQIDVENFI